MSSIAKNSRRSTYDFADTAKMPDILFSSHASHPPESDTLEQLFKRAERTIAKSKAASPSKKWYKPPAMPYYNAPKPLESTATTKMNIDKSVRSM
jgi:hypothetical protein